MKTILTIFLVCFALIGNAQSSSSSIAIVELFTSQGCSSCPAADKLLQDAVNAQSDLGEVYGLSFHVSYWNRLGWTDPYSSDEYTNRQKWYASNMRLSRIYTPQMIVDGRDEFVGSQKAKLTQKLRTSFADHKKKDISLSEIKRTKGQLNFSYQCNLSIDDMVIHVALVQKVASNRVPRGENRHKVLTHSNVVRAFKTQPLQGKAKVTMKIPLIEKSAAYELILYAQDQNSLEILAVGKSAI